MRVIRTSCKFQDKGEKEEVDALNGKTKTKTDKKRQRWKTEEKGQWEEPANIPDDGEKDNGDDVDDAGQLPQPVVGVDHWDVPLHLSAHHHHGIITWLH